MSGSDSNTKFNCLSGAIDWFIEKRKKYNNPIYNWWINH